MKKTCQNAEETVEREGELYKSHLDAVKSDFETRI